MVKCQGFHFPFSSADGLGAQPEGSGPRIHTGAWKKLLAPGFGKAPVTVAIWGETQWIKDLSPNSNIVFQIKSFFLKDINIGEEKTSVITHLQDNDTLN